MAWDRVINLKIGADGTGLLISDLHIDFRVEKSIFLSENFAEFTVYNAKADTRNKILRQGNNVIFELGYKDEAVSTVFIGNIIESVTSNNNIDYLTKIKAVSAQGSRKSIAKVPVSLSYTTNTLVSVPLKNIAAFLGLVVHGAQNANVRMVNGWTYVGGANGALRYLQDILKNQNIGLYIDSDEIVVYKVGEASRFNTVFLTYTGGLLSIKDITKPEEPKQNAGKTKKNVSPPRKTVAFESIIIPQLQVDSPITFKTDELSGTFITQKLVFVGNNYGGAFNVKGEAAI
jgi:hypothetical protein